MAPWAAPVFHQPLFSNQAELSWRLRRLLYDITRDYGPRFAWLSRYFRCVVCEVFIHMYMYMYEMVEYKYEILYIC